VPRPHNPNTGAATAASVLSRQRAVQQRLAEQLRSAKWTVLPPVDFFELASRLGITLDEQYGFSEWIGDPVGTVYTEAEAATIMDAWKTDPHRNLTPEGD
jgi:hypothetical protein